jgi:hypothetical protein
MRNSQMMIARALSMLFEKRLGGKHFQAPFIMIVGVRLLGKKGQLAWPIGNVARSAKMLILVEQY